VSYLHRLIRCLGVILGDKMNNYMIYTPISSIMRSLGWFERFCRIQVCKPKSQD